MATQQGFPVKVYIYDLSKGLARSLSQGFLGRQIDGIWHTGIVVYGEEYFFGGSTGIECCRPGGTILGQPDQMIEVGKTEIPKDLFMEYLRELSSSTYKPDKYHLLDHNCNTFSNEAAEFLTGKGIPSHITSLPADVLSTPFGAMIRPFVDEMHVQGGHSLFPAPGNYPAGSRGNNAS
ncbi:desumoylating isopeptidase 1-like [Littorina saxatilis]|uniref:PPPDE domain-containing protein n=1 Tax=Littorina saxatilis TaxID=31220 RepID=A0AAN9GMZ3_9CAEN